MATKYQPIFPQLEDRAKKVLQHYAEDLYEHDQVTLNNVCKPGQVWLWQVRPTGTWLLRWDEDPQAGSRNSVLESIIRVGVNGNWGDARWYLFQVHSIENGRPVGIVSGKLSVSRLAEQLPRPKPKAERTVELPPIKPQFKTITVEAGK